MTVNWGILSTAHINRRVIPAIRHSGKGQLLAVASRDLDKAREYSEQWHIPHAYGSYEDLLANDSIHAVYISLPNHLHTEWIIKTLAAGKHVLCEKPMCMNMADLESIEDVMQETGLLVMEGLMHLHHPQTHLWKSIIDSGALGEIQNITSSFSFTLDRPEDNYRWDGELGGGAVWDVGVYPVSLMQYLLDEVPHHAMAAMDVQDGIDVSTSGMLQFKGAKSGQFFVSFRSEFSTDTCIHGTQGQLMISHPYTNVDACHAFIRSGNKTERIEVPREYLYAGEIENMHDMILSGAPSRVPISFSKKVLQTLELLWKNKQT
jgi:D-xylose 1-dehydrogenase (NADP+, D-xylono-1,5-lactone-forming)